MTRMTSVNDIRSAFLDFFKGKGHEVMPSSSLVPDNDPTLMFANAGMNQFKNVFSGAEILHDKDGQIIKRATTSQKCVRAGGKHNDLENVGYTARHHTFFEMLGNFSFGDYFKEDAIRYAWEFLTSDKWMNLPAEKLYITIYHTDDEAYDIWSNEIGLPDEKIIRISTKDNFWEMGATGPCGPCSEIFYDHGEQYWGDKPGTADEDGDRYIEIWNLVFMQYEKLADGTQINLPKPCIDTGMGLERMAAVKQHVNNNYEIDLFTKIIGEISNLVNHYGLVNNEAITASYRVIADHLRCCSFLIADGVIPSNEGRGYVLRRIMRRAMRHAHILGCEEAIIYKLVPILVDEMGNAFPELSVSIDLISESLFIEEVKFRETLERGLKILDEEANNAIERVLGSNDNVPPILSGKIAFKLHDTYGFPLDLTQDHLRSGSQQIEVDIEGFNKSMEEQKARARAAWKGSGDVGTDELWFDIDHKYGATEFLGYYKNKASGKILAIIKDGENIDNASKNDEVIIVTNQTPFYAESGGQAGDKGRIKSDNCDIYVSDTKKQIGKIFAHISEINDGSISVGDDVSLIIDEKRRNKIRSNHSATHILHAALRKNLGDHVTQKGSLVEENYFRFDFSNSKAVSNDDLIKIENEVNEIIKQKSEVSTKIMTPDEAVKQGAMALFGEKYGDKVRVLSMGNTDDKSYSVELCGGTHVSNTSDIDKFKIIKESSVAAGIRRIEAKTGSDVDEYIADENKKKAEQEKRLKEQNEEKLKKKGGIQKEMDKFSDGIGVAEEIDGIKYYGVVLNNVHPKELRQFTGMFNNKVDKGIVVIITDNDGKVGIVVSITSSITDKYSAVDLIKIGTETLGGRGGGGKADFAQGGGSDISKADEAIKAIKTSIFP